MAMAPNMKQKNLLSKPLVTHKIGITACNGRKDNKLIQLIWRPTWSKVSKLGSYIVSVSGLM